MNDRREFQPRSRLAEVRQNIQRKLGGERNIT